MLIWLIFDIVRDIESDEVILTFGRRLRQLRTSRKLSQEDLANLAEVPISQVGRIERGDGNPTLRTMHALAKALGVSIVLILQSDGIT